MYKSFITSYLDYGDIMYHKGFNQYNATLAITGAITGSSTENIYVERGLESLKSIRWYRKMIFFFCIKLSKVNHIVPF